MSGRPTAAQVSARADESETVGGRIGGRLARSEPRQRATGYVRGLLSSTERENGWPLAEHLGDPAPGGVPHRLARADWDADAVRGDLLGYGREHLGHPGGVPVVDGTGFPRKGTKSCGVARPYSGTAGRIENGQVGVLLGCATENGRALVDRARYLPEGWADDAERRGEAGVPGEAEFATKIVPARRVIDGAVAAGRRAKWVTADAAYGSDYRSRTAVEGHGLGYVAGVRTASAVRAGSRQVRAGAPLAGIPADAWHRLSGGDGAKGPRVYDRPLTRTNSPAPGEYARWLSLRRSTSDPADVAYFACGGPPTTTPNEWVRVAGARWAVGDLFELAKGDCGSDGYEVRGRTGWHRPITRSLLAPAVVAVIRSRAARPAEEGARG